MSSTKRIVIGVHIGGSGLQCAAVDLDTGCVVPHSHVVAKVDKDASGRHIIPFWSMKIKRTLSVVNLKQVVGIGFAIPGPFDYVNGTADFTGVPKFEQLKGLNITRELNRRLMLPESLEIRYVNDAVGFAIGQDWMKTLDREKGMVIVLDSGLGSCFLVKNLPVFEGYRIPPGGVLYSLPYKHAIADDSFSIRGLVDELSRHGCSILVNDDATLRAARSNAKGLEVFNQFGRNLGDFLTPFVKAFDPGYISFGGLVGVQLELYQRSLQEVLHQNDLSVEINTPSEGNLSFIQGATRLFDEGYWRQLFPLLQFMD